MSKVNCVCGNQISDVCMPSVTGGYLLGECALDEREDVSRKLDTADSLTCAAMDIGRDFWECDQCGRIAFGYPEDGPNKIRWWSPETGGYAKLVYPKK